VIFNGCHQPNIVDFWILNPAPPGQAKKKRLKKGEELFFRLTFPLLSTFFSPPFRPLYIMLPKLFLLAATALVSINAQSASGFTFKETYPSSGSKPAPKPEWMELIKNANITNAPVLKANGDDGRKRKRLSDCLCILICVPLTCSYRTYSKG
jgi:hypothetical protein